MSMTARKFQEFVKGVVVFSKLHAAKQPRIMDLFTAGNSLVLLADGD